MKVLKIILMIFSVLAILFSSYVWIALETVTVKKPVIYLYPTQKQTVSVKVSYEGKITCSYPEYKQGWKVVAWPDGKINDLTDSNEYAYLFWEGEHQQQKFEFREGFVVKGEETAKFLRKKLQILGLSTKEANDFVVFWLPQMQANKYNLISFDSKEYEKLAKLEVSPKPDTMIRVFMFYKPLNQFTDIKQQEINPIKRKGFSVVEWGGVEVR